MAPTKFPMTVAAPTITAPIRMKQTEPKNLTIIFFPLFYAGPPSACFAYYSKKLGITMPMCKYLQLCGFCITCTACRQCPRPNAPPTIAKPRQSGVLYIAVSMRPCEPTKPNGGAWIKHTKPAHGKLLERPN